MERVWCVYLTISFKRKKNEEERHCGKSDYG